MEWIEPLNLVFRSMTRSNLRLSQCKITNLRVFATQFRLLKTRWPVYKFPSPARLAASIIGHESSLSLLRTNRVESILNMKLTPVLCKFRRMFVGPQPKFRGSALTGKHRFVPPAHRGNRYMLWMQWRNQEEVMKYISAPYITQDQELDYLDSIGLKHHDVDPLHTSKLEPPMRQRYATDIIEYFERNRKHEEWE